MRKGIKQTLIAGVFIASILGILTVFYYRKLEKSNYEKRGMKLVSRVEAFRKLNKKLPVSVAEMGIDEVMNDGPYYEKKDTGTYIVYFNIGFDNGITYHSKNKKWVYEP